MTLQIDWSYKAFMMITTFCGTPFSFKAFQIAKTFIKLFIKLCHLVYESVHLAFEIRPNDRSKEVNFFLLKLDQTASVSTSCFTILGKNDNVL
jgi:hypothetical protein